MTHVLGHGWERLPNLNVIFKRHRHSHGEIQSAVSYDTDTIAEKSQCAKKNLKLMPCHDGKLFRGDPQSDVRLRDYWSLSITHQPQQGSNASHMKFRIQIFVAFEA